MRLLRYGLVLAAMVGAAHAQLPDMYKKIGRVVWLVNNVEGASQAWTQLGLADVRDAGRVVFEGQYRGGKLKTRARMVSGRLGTLPVDMLQPERGEHAFSAFQARHGDGIFSVVHDVASSGEMDGEIARMQALGIGVLQKVTFKTDGGPATYAFFDTEAQGKYVLGLAYRPGTPAPAGGEHAVSHVAFVIRDPAAVSEYWERLGFPAMPVSHASPREDSRYRGKPLLLHFDVGWHRYSQPGFEWIVPPQDPANCYNDFLKIHGEGVQHLGLPVPDLEKAVAAYKALGYSVWQSGAWGEWGQKNSGRYAYMETDAIGGVTAELIQAIP